MQTTLRIDDEIYRRAKAKAAELGLSLTRFLEESVEERLSRLDQPSPRHVELPSCDLGGPTSVEELKRRIEEVTLEDDLRKLHGSA